MKEGVARCMGPGLDIRFPLAELEGAVEGGASQETDLTPFLIMEAFRKAVLGSGAINYVNA